MSYKYRNPQNRMRAASLLRQLKDQLIDVTGVGIEAFSNVYASSEAYWQLSKATGVHVYRYGGGWHGDLEFGGLPPGIPTIVGTPEPVATRTEAVESVVGMMSICAQRDDVTPPDPATGMRWFRFDELEVPVDPGMLRESSARVPVTDITRDEVLRALDDLRTEISDDGPVTRSAFDAASARSRHDACRMCCVAMAFGIGRVNFDPSRDRGPVDGMSPAPH